VRKTKKYDILVHVIAKKAAFLQALNEYDSTGS